ncbi:MAG TPA: hypothetical protein VD884_10945 [Ohtaekwangia sp.]|nr:hypothetical protein [Ohtaekwangia sp.]
MRQRALVYRYNNLFLVVITILVMMIVFVPLRNTLNLTTRYFSILQRQNNLHNHFSDTLPVLSLDKLEEVDIDKNTFQILSNAAQRNHVIIETMESALVVPQSEHDLFTKKISIRGTFISIMNCLSETVSNLNYIKITSITFEREQRGKSHVLMASVYFQTIKPK